MDVLMKLDMKPLCLYPKYVKIRARTFRITETELQTLSFQEFRTLVKKRFRQMIKINHPDTRNSRFAWRGEKASPDFIRKMRTYRFLMNLNENDLRITREEKKSLSCYPIPYYPLPWHWKREIKLPDGFHEVIRWD